MKCLAVNTATKTLSVSLVDGDKALYFFGTAETRDQGNLLLGHIQDGLKESDIAFDDLDVLAVVTGPGSFTGIRIGLAALRGIAMAAAKPLIGISSFDMFSMPEHDSVNIVAVESWREELYFAVLDEEGHVLTECMNETPEIFAQQFRHRLPDVRNIVISGDAREAVAPFFKEAAVAGMEQNAADVARHALRKFKKGAVFPKPLPYYLREADVTISTKISKTLKER